MKLNCFRFFEPFGRPLFIALRSYDQNTVMETNSSLCLQSTTHFVWILLDTSYAINHTTLNQIHNLIYVAKKIFSRYMDNAVCLYSLVQCPKAIDNQNPQSRFLRIEKSTSSNWGLGFRKLDINKQILSIIIRVYTRLARSCTVPLNAI